MGNRHGRRWIWQPWLALAAVLSAVSVLLTVVAMGGARQSLLREATTSAAVVGRAMVRQFETPIRFGVPLASVVGVPEFLDEVRRSTSGIAYIAVTDTKGQVLYASGAAVGTVLPVPAELGPESDLTPEINRLEPYLDVGWPLGDPGRAVGFVHVGADERLALPFLWSVSDEILVAWAIALLVALQVVAFLIVHHLLVPLAELRRLMAAVRAGNFARAGIIGEAAPSGSALSLMRGWVHEINARYQRLAQRIEEARAAHFDPAIVAEIDQLRQIVVGRFASERLVGQGIGQATGLVGGSRMMPKTGFALFFLVAAVEVCRPFLVVQAQLLAQDWLGLPPTLGGALLATALLLSGGIGIIASGWIAPAGRARETMLAGFVLTCVALALAGAVQGYARLLTCLALAGIGFGLVLGAGAAGPAAGLVEARRSAAVLALPVVLALICGPALGGYVVDRLGSGAVFPIAALLVAAAAALALAESGPGGGEDGAGAESEGEPEAEGHGVVATSLERLVALLALAVVGGTLFCLLPGSWAETTEPMPLIGLIAGLLGLAALIFRPFSGLLARRSRLSTRLGLAGIVAGLGLLGGLVWAPGIGGIAAATIAIGAALGLAVGDTERRGLRAVPLLPIVGTAAVRPRTAAALALACLAAGPALMAVLIALWGIASAATATAAISIVAGLALLLLRRRRPTAS